MGSLGLSAFMIAYSLPSMARSQPVTLQEVAAKAGVSTGTASRVLNGKNKENRPAIARRSEEIRQIALQLGYRPNTAARSITSGRFGAIAFVTCGDPGIDWYPISGLNGIHTAVEKSEWRLVFNELPAAKINNPRIIPQILRESSVDGLIVNLLPIFSEQTVHYFERQHLPCVLWNLKRALRCVYPDEFSGAMLAVKWLAEHGHQRIGYFSRAFPPAPHYSAMDRFAGFEHAMRGARLDAHRRLDLLAPSNAPTLTQVEYADRFLRRFPDLQAVICYEAGEAISLTHAAERLGRRVPEDLEVIAFSERDVRGNTGLPIPTVAIPFQEVGRHAVELLKQMLEHGDRNLPSIAVPYKNVIL